MEQDNNFCINGNECLINQRIKNSQKKGLSCTLQGGHVQYFPVIHEN